jgi:mono/diheme cytochrome c family protein
MSRRRRRALAVAAVILAALAVWLAAAPPRGWLELTRPAPAGDPVEAGRALVEAQGCRDCHRLGGQGALLASDLAGVARRLDAESLRGWLVDPRAMQPGVTMPNPRLSQPEIDAVLAYLAALDAATPAP